MVKLRQAGYCNLKLFALYITIYAHLIEPQIYKDPVLYEIYRSIYFFHMPLFSFLSGLFLQQKKQCAHQSRRALGLYILAQGVYLLAEPTVFWHTPYWHLWYLLSLSIWSAAGWLWHKTGCRYGPGLLALFLAIGCLCGAAKSIDRQFSASRTLVFLPYFWAGILCKKDLPFCPWLGSALLAAGCLLIQFAGDAIRPVFLYQAAPYAEHGAIHRLLCYAIGGCLCLGLVFLRPSRRFWGTRAGSDTLLPYLLHAPVVRFLWDFSLHPAILAVIPGVYLYVLYKIKQWHAPMYGIASR